MNTFKELTLLPVVIEIHEISNGRKMFGLKYGQGVVAHMLGMKRKEVIGALDWADANNEEAEKILLER